MAEGNSTAPTTVETGIALGLAARRGTSLPWHRTVLFALVAMLLLAFGVELTLRVLSPEIYRFAVSYRSTHHYVPWHGNDLRANCSAHFVVTRAEGSPLLDFRLTTNDLGLREIHDGPSPLDAKRPVVHCLGDSFTMGWGVNDDECYPALLAGHLRKTHRVLNLGVDGYGLLATLEKSQQISETYPPDVLIYLYCSNDFTDDLVTQSVQGRGWIGHARAELLDFLYSNSYLANTSVAMRYHRTFHGHAGAVPQEPTLDLNALAADMRQRCRETNPVDNATTQALERFAARCRTEQRRFVAAFCSPDESSLAMLRRCRELGIESVVVPLCAYEQYVIPGDGHLNVEGNRRLAESISREVFKKD